MASTKSPSADIDLLEIWSYISQDSFDAADQFLDQLEQQFDLLASSPLIGKKRDELIPGLRSLTYKNYLIFYRTRNDDVEIIRVLHGARDIEKLFKDEF